MNREVRLVIVDELGRVHDLGRSNGCSVIKKLVREFSLGGERYVRVEPVQVKVFKLPGCTACFHSEPAFNALISASL